MLLCAFSLGVSVLRCGSSRSMCPSTHQQILLILAFRTCNLQDFNLFFLLKNLITKVMDLTPRLPTIKDSQCFRIQEFWLNQLFFHLNSVDLFHSSSLLSFYVLLNWNNFQVSKGYDLWCSCCEPECLVLNFLFFLRLWYWINSLLHTPCVESLELVCGLNHDLAGLLLLSGKILCAKELSLWAFELAQIFKGINPCFILQRKSCSLLEPSAQCTLAEILLQIVQQI